MQMCGYHLKVYDESDHAKCPYCLGEMDDNITEDTDHTQPWTGECGDCSSSGRTECDVCEGESEIYSKICPKCNGDGDMECSVCDGTGQATYQMGKRI